MFHAPFPWYVSAMWMTIGVLVALGFVYSFYNQSKNKPTEEEQTPYNPYDPTIDIEPFSSKTKTKETGQ